MLLIEVNGELEYCSDGIDQYLFYIRGVIIVN